MLWLHRYLQGLLVHWWQHMPAAQWPMAVQPAARNHTQQRLHSWQLALPAAHRCPGPHTHLLHPSFPKFISIAVHIKSEVALPSRCHNSLLSSMHGRTISTEARHADTYQAADGSSQRLATLLQEAAGAGLWRGGGGAALLADMRRGTASPHQAWPLYEALVQHSASLLAPEQQVMQPTLSSTPHRTSLIPMSRPHSSLGNRHGGLCKTCHVLPSCMVH